MPIRERTRDRDERIYDFYRNLWLGSDAPRLCGPGQAQINPPSSEIAVFEDEVVVNEAAVRGFVRATGYRSTDNQARVPLDFSIVLG